MIFNFVIFCYSFDVFSHPRLELFFMHIEKCEILGRIFVT